jgi:hypothetical protein
MTSDTDAADLVDRDEWLRTRPRKRRLVAAAETNSACSVVEMLSHRGDSQPMPVHGNEDKYFLIPAGAARIARGSNCSQLGSSVAEWHLEAVDHLRQAAGSSLVRRLVLAKDDPVKQRIRAWLSDVEDERLFSLCYTSDDIAALRGTARRSAEATIDAPSEDSGGAR